MFDLKILKKDIKEVISNKTKIIKDIETIKITKISKDINCTRIIKTTKILKDTKITKDSTKKDTKIVLITTTNSK